MIAVLMMVVGAILAILGFAGLVALMFEPVYTMYEVIFKRKADLVYYETKPGKALLQRNKKSLRGSCIFFLVVGLALFGAGFFMKYGPRGTDSLFSKQVEAGTGQGDASASDHQSREINEAGNYVDSEGVEYKDYVIIKKDTVSYRDEFTGSVEDFENFVKRLDGVQVVYIVDKYAVASVYREAVRVLKDHGFRTKEMGVIDEED